MPDKYLLRPIVDPGNQSVLIALNIENCALSEHIGARPCDSYVCQAFPGRFSGDAIPRIQARAGLSVGSRRFFELFSAYYPHLRFLGFFALCEDYIINLRKMRTTFVAAWKCRAVHMATPPTMPSAPTQCKTQVPSSPLHDRSGAAERRMSQTPEVAARKITNPISRPLCAAERYSIAAPPNNTAISSANAAPR